MQLLLYRCKPEPLVYNIYHPTHTHIHTNKRTHHLRCRSCLITNVRYDVFMCVYPLFIVVLVCLYSIQLACILYIYLIGIIDIRHLYYVIIYV